MVPSGLRLSFMPLILGFGDGKDKPIIVEKFFRI